MDRNSAYTAAGAWFSKVAHYARAWIEIELLTLSSNIDAVALYARAWIEIERTVFWCFVLTGRPLREGVDRNN